MPRNIGHCVHRIAMHPSRPKVLFMQKHWDVMHSDDAGESWRESPDAPLPEAVSKGSEPLIILGAIAGG